jgi:hypothetical protein
MIIRPHFLSIIKSAICLQQSKVLSHTESITGIQSHGPNFLDPASSLMRRIVVQQDISLPHLAAKCPPWARRHCRLLRLTRQQCLRQRTLYQACNLFGCILAELVVNNDSDPFTRKPYRYSPAYPSSRVWNQSDSLYHPMLPVLLPSIHPPAPEAHNATGP